MELRTNKVLSIQPPKRLYANVYQAFVFEKRKELGSNFDKTKVNKDYDKLSQSEKDRLAKLIMQDGEKYEEDLFHYNNQISGRGKQKYQPAPNVPEKPKKPMGSFFRFLDEKRSEYQAKNKDLPYTEIVKLASQDFNNLPAKEVKVYEDAFNKEKGQYLIELKKWNEKYGNASKAKSKSRRSRSNKSDSKKKGDGKKNQSSGRTQSDSAKKDTSRSNSKSKNKAQMEVLDKDRNNSAGSKKRGESEKRSDSKKKSDSKKRSDSKKKESSGEDSKGKKKSKDGKMGMQKKANTKK